MNNEVTPQARMQALAKFMREMNRNIYPGDMKENEPHHLPGRTPQRIRAFLKREGITPEDIDGVLANPQLYDERHHDWLWVLIFFKARYAQGAPPQVKPLPKEAFFKVTFDQLDRAGYRQHQLLNVTGRFKRDHQGSK